MFSKKHTVKITVECDEPVEVKAQPKPSPRTPTEAHENGDVASTFECCGATKTEWMRTGYIYGSWYEKRCDEHKETCPRLEDYPLEPFKAAGICPKCRQAVKTSHYTGRHYEHRNTGFGFVSIPGCYASGYLYRSAEHLDRDCSCGYSWQEKVAPRPKE